MRCRQRLMSIAHRGGTTGCAGQDTARAVSAFFLKPILGAAHKRDLKSAIYDGFCLLSYLSCNEGRLKGFTNKFYNSQMVPIAQTLQFFTSKVGLSTEAHCAAAELPATRLMPVSFTKNPLYLIAQFNRFLNSQAGDSGYLCSSADRGEKWRNQILHLNPQRLFCHFRETASH